MPTYQYLCHDCGFKFEEFQSMVDKPIDKCPECGGNPKRLISGGAGFLFKGSGFYITDYRSSQYKKDASAEKSSPSPSSSDSDKSAKKTGDSKTDS